MAQVRAGASVDELYRVEGKAEIVNGELVLMCHTGSVPGRAGGAIYRSLFAYEEKTGSGYAFPDNVGFIVNLPTRRSFSPDAAFHVGPLTGGRFLDGAPVFAAEVRSEDDYGLAAEKRLAQKRADYFAAGTRVVWDVDVLRDELVRSYAAERSEEPRVLRQGEVADAEPWLPGWAMLVADLFKGNPRR
jgi:Uma2 family endonuclease